MDFDSWVKTFSEPGEGKIKIISNDEYEIYAYEKLLVIKSEYFANLFGGKFKESKTKEVKINYERHIIEFVLFYLFTSNTVHIDVIADYFKCMDLARYLGVDSYIIIQSKKLETEEDISNIIKYIHYSKLYSFEYLEKKLFSIFTKLANQATHYLKDNSVFYEIDSNIKSKIIIKLFEICVEKNIDI